MALEGNPAAKGYALWLVPAEPAFSVLASTISRFAREYSTPRFEPHITLLGGIVLQEEKALAKSASLARILEPFRLELCNIGFLDEDFRCLFVTVVAGYGISGAYRAACRIFARQNTPYIPHVSLVYGRLPLEVKQRIATGLSSLSGRAFRVRQLSLNRVNGPVHQWKAIQTFDL